MAQEQDIERLSDTHFFILDNLRKFLFHSIYDCNSLESLQLLKAQWQKLLTSDYLTQWKNDLSETARLRMDDWDNRIRNELEQAEKWHANPQQDDPQFIRKNHLRPVFSKLYELFDKTFEFTENAEKNKNNPPQMQEYLNASVAALNVCNNIDELIYNYQRNQRNNNSFNLDEFKTEAKNILAEENLDIQILNSHRGVKQILVNLLMNIGSLVYAY